MVRKQSGKPLIKSIFGWHLPLQISNSWLLEVGSHLEALPFAASAISVSHSQNTYQKYLLLVFVFPAMERVYF